MPHCLIDLAILSRDTPLELEESQPEVQESGGAVTLASLSSVVGPGVPLLGFNSRAPGFGGNRLDFF